MSEIKAFEYEKQAMDGQEMPDGLEYPEQVAFLSFRMLYAQLRMGIITREVAIREKKKLLDEYRQYKFVESLGKEWVQIIKDTEAARAAYRKDRSLENADQLIFAIDGGNYAKQLS